MTMKIGLDTTVLVRLLVGEPAHQAQLARTFLERALASGDDIVASDLALAEAYHALHYHYGVPKGEALTHLRAMLASGVVQIDPPGSLWAFEPLSGAGLVDRLIVARHRANRATTWTFDRKLAALEGVVRVSIVKD
jgi:predicted nucleic acid-binding protein